MHVCMYACLNVSVCVCVVNDNEESCQDAEPVNVCMYVCIYVTPLYACMHACKYVCKYVCL
jgi:hypothetical protein